MWSSMDGSDPKGYLMGYMREREREREVVREREICGEGREGEKERE
jgi:hypothetical protein